MELGSLAAIWRYPVKSLAGEQLDACAVEESGLAGDRTAALLVSNAEHPRAGKPYRGKEHERFHLVADVEAATVLAADRGIDVAYSQDDRRYFDDAPVSIIIDRWLDGLSEHVGYRVEYQRFRPNLFVVSPHDVPTEDQLTGRMLVLGDVMLRVRNPIERCVVTTYHPNGEPSDPRILRYVAQERSTWMGIYCDVIETGTVRSGARLRLVDDGH